MCSHIDVEEHEALFNKYSQKNLDEWVANGASHSEAYGLDAEIEEAETYDDNGITYFLDSSIASRIDLYSTNN